MASITIASTTVNNWQGPTAGVVLNVYVNSSFAAASGNLYPQSVPSNPASLGTFYLSVPCTVSGNVLTIPTLTLDSTTDSTDNSSARYSAVFFDTLSQKAIQTFGQFGNFLVPATPTSTSWPTLAVAQLAGFTSSPGVPGTVSTFSASGAATIGGLLTANAGVSVSGGTTTDTFKSTGAGEVDGVASLKGGATVTGGATTDTLTVTGTANLQGSVIASGNLTASNGTVLGKVLQLADGATVTDATGNGYGAAFAIADNIGNIALAIMPDGSTRLFGNASVYGSLLMGSPGTTIAPLATNALNALWAVVDSLQSVALYVDANGNTTIGGNATINGNLQVNGSLNANVTATGALIGGAVLAAISAPGSSGNFNGYSFAIVDAAQKIALAVDSNGYLHGHFAFDPMAGASQDSFGGFYYTKRDFNGFYQLFYMPAGGVEGSEVQLTSGTFNSSKPAVCPDGSILYISDATGTTDYWRMGPTGESPVPVTGSTATNTLLQEADYNVIILTGQSVSNGYGSAPTPCISTTQPFGNLMLGPDPRGGAQMFDSGAGVTLNVSGLTLNPLTAGSFIPDGGTFGGTFASGWGETQANGIADSLSRMFASRGYKGVFVVIQSGGNGDKEAYIAKNGTFPFYANAIAMLQQVVSIATAAGKRVSVRAVATVIGDGDQVALTPSATFTQAMLTLQQNYEADCKAITGQLNGVPLIQSTICLVNAGQTTSYIQEAALDATEAAPGKVVLYGPRYQFPYCDPYGSNYAHMTPDGYRNHGENIAKAVFAAVQNKPWTGLRPKTWRLLGNRILINFHVPVAPLVIDTTTLAAVPTTGGYFPGGMYGFEFSDGSGSSPTITAVNIYDPTTVEILLSAAPTGPSPQIAYAVTGQTNHRAYGNLRDSDTSPSFYGYTNTWNWCTGFIKPLSY